MPLRREPLLVLVWDFPAVAPLPVERPVLRVAVLDLVDLLFVDLAVLDLRVELARDLDCVVLAAPDLRVTLVFDVLVFVLLAGVLAGVVFPRLVCVVLSALDLRVAVVFDALVFALLVGALPADVLLRRVCVPLALELRWVLRVLLRLVVVVLLAGLAFVLAPVLRLVVRVVVALGDVVFALLDLRLVLVRAFVRVVLAAPDVLLLAVLDLRVFPRLRPPPVVRVALDLLRVLFAALDLRVPPRPRPPPLGLAPSFNGRAIIHGTINATTWSPLFNSCTLWPRAALVNRGASSSRSDLAASLSRCRVTRVVPLPMHMPTMLTLAGSFQAITPWP